MSSWFGSTAPTVGQKAMASSIPVALASDQSPLAVTSIVPGVGPTSLGKQEDAVAADADVGVAALGVRQDNPMPTVGTTGDYAFLALDPNGRLWVNSGAQNLEALARVRNLLLAQQAQIARAPVGGFVPVETPDFLTGG